MILKLSNPSTLDSFGIEQGVYYFVLSDYPHISTSELKNAVAFVRYEKKYGRETKIICEDENTLQVVIDATGNLDITDMPTEKFVYHATDATAAKKILSCGKLLSAIKVYGKTGDELAYNKRNSLWNDPADFFEYIMFCGGEQMTGDYVVLSENMPSEDDLEKGNFNAGVRFYFRYEDVKKHPKHIHDGYHPIKVKDEVILSDYLYACIVPGQYKQELNNLILPELVSKVHFVPQNKNNLYNWNEKVCDFINKL
ncbi:MAG: hypothetical protein FWC09_02120 [Lachnospiraceae bacterium]|nr:hypothetical protein [Lachnospiraceae bacterium]